MLPVEPLRAVCGIDGSEVIWSGLGGGAGFESEDFRVVPGRGGGGGGSFGGRGGSGGGLGIPVLEGPGTGILDPEPDPEPAGRGFGLLGSEVLRPLMMASTPLALAQA